MNEVRLIFVSRSFNRSDVGPFSVVQVEHKLTSPTPLCSDLGAASASSAPREAPPRTARHSSASQHSPVVTRHSRSTSNISDLELLSLAVQSINAALSSGAVPAATASPGKAPASPDAAAKSGEAQPYMLSGAKFQPRGCVWDVSIKVSGRDYREDISQVDALASCRPQPLRSPILK